jgi:guanylate kinase
MENLKTIFCIQGFTASGKDSITKQVSKDLNIPILVSHTTRPKRINETEGIEYYFVDDKFFEDNKNDFLENREYKTVKGIWRYGLHKEELKNKPYSIFIVDKQGYKTLEEKLGVDKLVSIFIEVSEYDLRQRLLLRGDCLLEFERRLKSDIEEFRGHISDYIVYNKNLDAAIEKVKNIIKEEMGE